MNITDMYSDMMCAHTMCPNIGRSMTGMARLRVAIRTCENKASDIMAIPVTHLHGLTEGAAFGNVSTTCLIHHSPTPEG